MSNKTQDAYYWFNCFIIAIGSAVIKTTQKHLKTLFSESMKTSLPETIYSWIQASGSRQTF